MPNSFPPSNPNSSQNSATTPDYSQNPDSANTPDSANSPDSTNNASSNTGNSDNKIFLLHTLVYLINSPWLASFSKNYPRLGNLLAILIPVSGFFLGTGTTAVSPLIVSHDIKQEFQLSVCQEYEEMVEQNINVRQGKPSVKEIYTSVEQPIENTDDQLPFLCKYKVQYKDSRAEPEEISLDINPVYREFDWRGNSKNEKKIDLNRICGTAAIKEQMQNDAGGQKIKAGKIELRSPDERYPVFRWICHYTIDREEKTKQGINEGSIGLELDKYCERQAKEEGTNLTKFGYHYYKDPYSLYCVNPYPQN